jgi:DNA-directed RNA polymerase specialized sigma24 family protein
MDQADVISSQATESEPERVGVTERWEAFNVEFTDLLHPKSSTGVSTFAFVRRYLAQFHLQNAFSEAYVLNEVYIRAHRTIVSKDTPILHVTAWVKSTAYNVVRELKRERSHLPIDEETMGETMGETFSYAKPDTEETLEQDLLLLHKALNELNSEDRRLIELKIIQDLSWQEIHVILVQEGSNTELSTLRKRKERAIARLRKTYHRLNPSH